ncbi:conserved hypothetical protein [Cenarchaeum symbiosum A]|uniref:Uncharacterized protein n=1 Tax=Cenarchaeum symbiosum (strain A) TaxID=414004 RepID=A0RXF6_CENSY|nr:conserved hypothetical protein [Cenarchaeum symbiosum A]
MAGASWASVWFRLNGNKRPSAEEFRAKVAEYMALLEPLYSAYGDTEEFAEMNKYIRGRSGAEAKRVIAGENGEIEKRYKRYIDYG